jgi:predicted kinase
MNKAATVIGTIGISHGGKSTWADFQKVLLNAGGYKCEIVCRDDIRRDLYGGRYDPTREADVSLEEVRRIGQLVRDGVDFILVPNCHHKRKDRDRLRNICRRYRCELMFEIIDTPVEECLRRAEAKGDDYIIPVIKKQAAEFEPLTEEELCSVM